jgi:hypothetical protein
MHTEEDVGSNGASLFSQHSVEMATRKATRKDRKTRKARKGGRRVLRNTLGRFKPKQPRNTRGRYATRSKRH